MHFGTSSHKRDLVNIQILLLWNQEYKATGVSIAMLG